jgi:hypothetical protein
MDPNATIIALCEAIRDQDRERCWDALEGFNDWIAKRGAFPDKVRAVPLTDADLLMISIGLIALLKAAKTTPISGLGGGDAQHEFAELGQRITGYIVDPDVIRQVNTTMKVSLGMDPTEPL